MRGQGGHRLSDPANDSRRCPALVSEQHRVAALALDKRCQARRAVIAPEDHQISFPMPEVLAACDLRRAMLDRHAGRNPAQMARLADKAFATVFESTAQEAIEIERAAL